MMHNYLENALRQQLPADTALRKTELLPGFVCYDWINLNEAAGMGGGNSFQEHAEN